MGDGAVTVYLAQHPVFVGLLPEQVAKVASLATLTSYAPNEYVFEQDKPADHFYIVRHGQVAVEVPSIDGDPFVIQSLGDGALLGWSWLVPPYRWNFDARATAPSTIIAVDGARLRDVCDEDTALGYQLLKRFAVLMAERLNAARTAAIRHYTGNWPG